MTEAQVLHIAQQAILITFKLCAPILMVSLTIGVAISLFQAVTSVQEMTLTFVPKLIVVFIVFSLTASFLGAQFYVFTERVYAQIERGFDR